VAVATSRKPIRVAETRAVIVEGELALDVETAQVHNISRAVMPLFPRAVTGRRATVSNTNVRFTGIRIGL